MIFSNFINWISELFLLNKKDNNFIGLQQLREAKNTVQSMGKNKNIKISNIIKSENY